MIKIRNKKLPDKLFETVNQAVFIYFPVSSFDLVRKKRMPTIISMAATAAKKKVQRFQDVEFTFSIARYINNPANPK